MPKGVYKRKNKAKNEIFPSFKAELLGTKNSVSLADYNLLLERANVLANYVESVPRDVALSEAIIVAYTTVKRLLLERK